MSESNREYFADESGAKAFGEAFALMVAQIHNETRSRYLSEENTHRFRHGGDWKHPASPAAIGGEMQQHSAFVETKFQDLVDNNLDAIERAAQQLTDAMEKQFVQMMYSAVSAACDHTGNTVDAKAEGSLEAAFMAMLEKIEFVANRHGEVQLPEIHVGPEAAAKLAAAEEAMTPEFKAKLEAIQARKIAEAKQREVERKARFLQYGDDACE